MCGIGSITFDKTVSPTVAARLDAAAGALLDALDSRGGDACGLLSVTANGAVRVQKAPCDAAAFNRGRLPVAPGARAVAVHTRMATQGEPHWNRNNHPVRCGLAHVIHNGVVYDTCTRVQGDPEVDTYGLAVAADGASPRREGESPQAHAERVALAMADEDGSAACIVAIEGEVSLYVMRLHSSPLYVAEAHGVRICASTAHAVGAAADALDIELPLQDYMRTVVKKKAKKGRPAVTRQVADVRECIDGQAEGAVLAWHAGSHTAGAVKLPYPLRPAYDWRRGMGSGSAPLWADEEDYSGWSTAETATYEHIAQRMLADDTTTDVYRLAPASDDDTTPLEDSRCDLCDTLTATTRAYDCECCADCLRAMGIAESDDSATADSARTS